MKTVRAILLLPLILSACGESGDQTPDSYPYGTAVNQRFFYNDQVTPEVAHQYHDALKEYFNWGVSENCMKMGNIHPEKDNWNFEPVDAMLDWFQANNLQLKCHVLVWGREPHAPQWLADLPTVEARRDALRDHIHTMGERYRDRIEVFDVVNEELHIDTWNQLLEWTDVEILVNSFTWAREVLPDARLLINDYSIIAVGDTRRDYIQQINDVIDQGGEIDAVGLQGHFGSGWLPPVADIVKALDEVHAGTGLQIHITEFDIHPPGDPDAPFRGFNDWWDYQAWAYPVAYRVFSRHPAVKMLFMWGFTDAAHWRPGAGILDADFADKPVTHTMAPLLKTYPPDAVRADCGLDLEATEGETVTLNGGPEGLTYAWSQITGPQVELDGTDGPNPTFIAPEVTEMRMLGFRLDVASTDAAVSVPDFQYVEVQPGG